MQAKYITIFGVIKTNNRYERGLDNNALFNNRSEVNVMDFKKAIMSSKNIYPDVITKSMPIFDVMFKDQISEYNEQTKNNVEKLSDDTM